MTKENFDYTQSFQGDVWMMRVPDKYFSNEETRIDPKSHQLILLEGELTGHNHAINVLDRTGHAIPSGEEAPSFEDLKSMFNDSKLANAFTNKAKTPVVSMFTASKIAAKLVADGILMRPDLVVGFLKIENGPVDVAHPEHGSIKLSPGSYIVGRQIESVAGEVRRVAD